MIQSSARERRLRVPPEGHWELLCYRLLPTARDILCSWEKQFIIVVVSPLAALMKDQVEAMSQRIVRAVHVRDAKKGAKVVKDKCRKLQAGSLSLKALLRDVIWWNTFQGHKTLVTHG